MQRVATQPFQQSPTHRLRRTKSSEFTIVRRCFFVAARAHHFLALIAIVAFLCVPFDTDLLAQSPSGAGAEVTVKGLNGEIVRGLLVSADTKQLTIKTGNSNLEKPANEISHLGFANKMDPQKGPVEISLLDGSKAFGDKLTGSNTGWNLRGSNASELTIPGKSIRAAKLKSIPPQLVDAWQTAIQETTESDAVIVMRAGESLDRINVIIVQVQEASVAFELDGQPIEIPIEKLVGLVWFQRGLDRIRPAVEIASTDHSVWMAETLNLTSNGLELQTQLGQKVSLPLSKIFGINYSTANIRWLAELETIEAVADKRIDFKSKIATLELALAPRFMVNQRAPTPTSSPGDQDLYFPSPGRFVFRVPEGFTTLQCQVQRTDEGDQRTDVMIEVWQDDNRIAQQSLAHDQESIDLNVPVQAGKKIRLAVGCSSKLMIGTEVQWKQPRLKR
jgi:hypothetical protein